MTPEIFSKQVEYSKKVDRLKRCTGLNVNLLQDTKKSKIEKLTKKFEADKEALIRKFDEKIKQQHDFAFREQNHLFDKYVAGFSK